MVSTAPGTSSSLVKKAHYHAVAATATYAAYVKGVQAVATNTAAARARRDAEAKRETTYARGTLGAT